MGKAGMLGPGERERGDAELTNATETLNLGGGQKELDDTLFVGLEGYEPVDWVTKDHGVCLGTSRAKVLRERRWLSTAVTSVAQDFRFLKPASTYRFGLGLHAMNLEHTARPLVEAAFANRKLLTDLHHRDAVEAVLAALDRGEIRVASPASESESEGEWITHTWIKQAVLLYFSIRKMETLNAGFLEYHDKIPVKTGLAAAGVRVVPPGVVRYGAFLEHGVILMPGYVNIGARVGSGTMIDTWATVGSCAQVGKDCHLSGGVGIGGVLEPASAQPVIIEDGVFVGSRCVIVEGLRVGKEAVLGAGVVLTASTAILDVTGPSVVEHRGHVPARSIVIPGTRPKRFPAGEFGTPCALIIGQRTEATDRKVSLNVALREFDVPV
jgi:2,3,4,5-tetrahydropyridine-2-carboxylate N-succinyltransferase